MDDKKIRKLGGNIRNFRTTHPNRRNRRQRAVERAQSHAERSVEDQLELIADRPGQSRREVLRITGGDFDDANVALHALRIG